MAMNPPKKKRCRRSASEGVWGAGSAAPQERRRHGVPSMTSAPRQQGNNDTRLAGATTARRGNQITRGAAPPLKGTQSAGSASRTAILATRFFIRFTIMMMDAELSPDNLIKNRASQGSTRSSLGVLQPAVQSRYLCNTEKHPPR